MHCIMCFLIWILKSGMFLWNAHVDFWLIELIFSGAGELECCFLFHCACVISIRNICVEWCLAKGFNWTEGYLKAQHAGRCSIQVNVFIVVATKPLCIKLHTLSFYLLETQGTRDFLNPKFQVRSLFTYDTEISTSY